MRKFAILGLFMILAGSLHAQRIIQTKSLQGALLLLYEMPLLQPESNDAIVVTPFLCGQQDTLALQPVYVRGDKNARRFLRGSKGDIPTFIPAAEVPSSFAQASEISTISHPWVKNDSLKLIVLTEMESRTKVKVIGVSYTHTFSYDSQALLPSKEGSANENP